MRDQYYTMGIDVGGSYVKAVLMKHEEGRDALLVDRHTEKIRKRNPSHVADEQLQLVLERNEMQYDDLAYVASTGEGDMVLRKKGHFYSMTTHARGAHYFFPQAKTVVDMGALYTRAIKMNNRSRVLDYKMTGQCASGSGQFIENISRYLGLAIEEVGEVSLQSDKAETPSGICAVLAETDVINMVSRGISTPNIIKGIHLSIGARVVRLLSSLKAEGPLVLTGGMALNQGMVQAVSELLRDNEQLSDLRTHPDAIYAGAIGAALWGAFRHRRLLEKELETS